MIKMLLAMSNHDDEIKWKHFPRYWSSVSIIHRSPMDSTHKGQWRKVLMLSLICAWTNGRRNNRDGGDLRRHLAHYRATAMCLLWHRECEPIPVVIEIPRKVDIWSSMRSASHFQHIPLLSTEYQYSWGKIVWGKIKKCHVITASTTDL